MRLGFLSDNLELETANVMVHEGKAFVVSHEPQHPSLTGDGGTYAATINGRDIYRSDDGNSDFYVRWVGPHWVNDPPVIYRLGCDLEELGDIVLLRNFAAAQFKGQR